MQGMRFSVCFNVRLSNHDEHGILRCQKAVGVSYVAERDVSGLHFVVCAVVGQNPLTGDEVVDLLTFGVGMYTDGNTGLDFIPMHKTKLRGVAGVKQGLAI